MAHVMALPHKGRLDAVFQMFSFLKSKHNAVAVFDHTEPNGNQTQCPTENWSSTSHGPCKEDDTSNSPMPIVMVFDMIAFFNLIMLETQSLVAQELVLFRSSTVLLCFFSSKETG